MPLDASSEQAFVLIEEETLLNEKLNSEFEAIDFFWAGDDYLNATKRNKELLVNQFRLPQTEYTCATAELIISEVIFHFFNYANSYISMRDFLYNGIEAIPENLNSQILSIVTSWKKSPYQRIINEMRNRSQHGGKLIRGINTRAQTVDNLDVPVWLVGIFLFDRAIHAIRRELPSKPKNIHRLFDAITAKTGEQYAFASFLDAAQESLEETYNSVIGLLKDHFAKPLVECKFRINPTTIPA